MIGRVRSFFEVGGTERTRTVIGLIDNQVPHLSATVPKQDVLCTLSFNVG
jgi:hypothetical protein